MKKYAPYRDDRAVNMPWWKMKGKRGKPEAVEAAEEAAEREAAARCVIDMRCLCFVPLLTSSFSLFRAFAHQLFLAGSLRS
jgi:hypothetical protein